MVMPMVVMFVSMMMSMTVMLMAMVVMLVSMMMPLARFIVVMGVGMSQMFSLFRFYYYLLRERG